MGTYKKPNRPIPHNSRRSTQRESQVEIITLDSTTHITFAEASAFSAKRSNQFNLQLTAAVNKIVDNKGGKPAEVPTIEFVRGLQNYTILVTVTFLVGILRYFRRQKVSNRINSKDSQNVGPLGLFFNAQFKRRVSIKGFELSFTIS